MKEPETGAVEDMDPHNAKPPEIGVAGNGPGRRLPLDLPPGRQISVSPEDLRSLDEVAPWEEYLFTPTGERIPKEVTDEDV
ncbi:hypothetical protein [Alicyclobacillus sp.]|uniref:hypothetical protein n=1 Tax=Alicyclobacillus sp. TaxID=61169 RepID=UPI0025C1025C|nr:hypothetical protein [Alicyclobacillus sp.]MCL6515907.1 hypothetical protein [Alicyclobacillus sp.]